MRYSKLIGSLLAAACSVVAFAQSSVIERVNPIIGTNGMGHTFPGASGYRYDSS